MGMRLFVRIVLLTLCWMAFYGVVGLAVLYVLRKLF